MSLPMLVVGGDSLIGRALADFWRVQGVAVIVTLRPPKTAPTPFVQFDLASDPWPNTHPIQAAVICAAVTRQDLCREDPITTRRINAQNTIRLAADLVAAGAFVVFLSTNLVFDGSQARIRPDDPLAPRTEYGRQKAVVEQALSQCRNRVAVVRLTKIFHPGLALLQQWRVELDAGRPITAFTDYVCSPIALPEVIKGLAQIAAGQHSGIWQFSGPTDVSYAELAKRFCRMGGFNPQLVMATPAPAGLLEHLPTHATLDASLATARLGLKFPNADAVLEQCLDPENQRK